MQKNTKRIVVWSSILVVVLGTIVVFATRPKKPGQYDAFARCVADSGAKFYGAFWCPHCQNQKAAFGSSAKLLPYIECSTPDGNSQTQVCKDANISGYPTWVFSDGVHLSGEVSLDVIAQKSGCALP